jgi:3,4-dihydroxy-2-butanone 4-phosphate synthase
VGEAYRAARQALQISPDDGTLLTAAVGLARTLGRTDDVEELYRDFLRLRPGHVGALRGLAEICRRAGRAEEAERLSETAGLLSATMN